MSNINIEKEFMKIVKEITEDYFYIPTDLHSSGFNKVEIYKLDEDDDVLNSKMAVYNISEENEAEKELTFEELMIEFPKVTLDRNYAFDEKFCSWIDIKSAFNGEKNIELFDL